MNNTTTTTILLQQNTGLESIVNNDFIGAAIYIIVVLLWYSSSVAILLGMQMTLIPTEIVEDSTRHSNKLFSQNFRDRKTHKNILEELGDKDNRDKLWDIYLGTSNNMNDRITRAETLRIRNIKRRLDIINDHSRDHKESIRLAVGFNPKFVSSVSTVTPSNSRLRTRRRSSLD